VKTAGVAGPPGRFLASGISVCPNDFAGTGFTLVCTGVPSGASAVTFSVNGGTVRVESQAPYTIAGDSGSYFSPWTPPSGPTSISCRSSTGTAFTVTNVRFSCGTTTTSTVTTSRSSVTPTSRSTATTRTTASTATTRPGTCGVTTLRRSLATIPQPELARYVAAVIALRNTPGTNGVSVYESFAQAHVNQVDNAHFGAYFLPWHRQMLYEFELALNRVAPPGPTISIPYWDWSVVNTNFKRDFDTWSKMGGGVDGQPIPNAPFARWTSRVESLHSVIRGFTVGGNVPASEFLASPATIDALVTGRDAFAVMSRFLESIHNSPHVSIGGDMNNLRASPNDPIFYSHHAYVDLIWRRWQLAGGQNTFGGTHPGTSNTPARLDQPQQPWGRTVRVILESLSLCVRYQIGSGSIRQGRSGSDTNATVPAATNSSSAPTTTSSDSNATTPVITTSIPSGGFGQGYTPARLDGNLGNKPSMFNSMDEKRKAQLKAAQGRVKDPSAAKERFMESSGAKKWMVTAMREFNYTAEEIVLSSASYDKYELQRGVDLLAWKPNASMADIIKSGETCISAIDAGKVPPHSDDTDVVLP
jgi:tyrosinase